LKNYLKNIALAFIGKEKIVTRNRVVLGYDAARNNRWTADFLTEIGTINREIKGDMVAVRKRARALWKNSSVIRAYRKRLISDVVGRDGFKLQMRCHLDNGDVDKDANDKIEAAWDDWSSKNNCTMSKTLNLVQVCYLLIEHYKRDGEFIARFIEEPGVNKYGFSLELIEPDLLDETYNVELSNGNSIAMGIEFNSWRQPVAYHFKKSTVADEMRGVYGYYQNGERVRIPAEQILHLFDQEHSNQFRGISHLAPVMIDIIQLKGYDEAAIIAARVGASSTMVITKQKDTETQGDDEDSEGNAIQNLSFGEVVYTQPGETPFNWTPNYPHDQYPEFVKTHLKRIAVALGMNYASLLGDLAEGNYGSLRGGSLIERDQWFVDQSFIINSFLRIIYLRWIKAVLFNSLYQGEPTIDLPYDPEKYNYPEFFGRTYPWIDPYKDVQATVLALNNNLTSLTRECKRMGVEFDDIIDERKSEQQKIKDAGLIISDKTTAKVSDKKPVVDDEEDPDDDEKNSILNDLIVVAKKHGNGHLKKLIEQNL